MQSKIGLFIIFFITIFFLNTFNVISKTDKVDLLKIYQNIRCLVCQGQSIEESNSDFAQNLKAVIQNKAKNGLSENEIYDFLKSKYGEWILLKPVFNYKNFFLWIFPYIIFVIGGISLFFIIKKSKSL